MPHIVARGYGYASSLFSGGWLWRHCKPNKPAILKFIDRSQLLGLIAEGEHSRLEFKERQGKILLLLWRVSLTERVARHFWRVGSGIKKMKKICQDEGCEPPAYESPHYFLAQFTSNPKTVSSR